MAAKRKPKITLENELKNIEYNPNIGHSMTFEKAHKCARETKNLTIIMELDYWGWSFKEGPNSWNVKQIFRRVALINPKQ